MGQKDPGNDRRVSPPRLVTRQKEFDAQVESLKRYSWFGMDTEFISERSFRPRLCLLQIVNPEQEFAVDPFEVQDLSTFLSLLLDPAIEKVLHSGQQDMMIFYDLLGATPKNIFDTQIAAAFLGYGDSIGYARLVETVLNVKLRKDETFTDWSKRPLSERQVEYALDDVHYLPPLHEHLIQQLDARGRRDWLVEEFEIYDDPDFYRRPLDKLYQRVKGVGRLGSKDLIFLQELVLWREREAESRDKPRARIVSDEVLVELARRKPRHLDGLRTMRGLHPRLIKRGGAEMLACIERARSAPKKDHPAPIPQNTKDPELAIHVDLLESLLKLHAADVEISPGYIATRSQLYRLAEAAFRNQLDSCDIPLLKGWRRRLIGDTLVGWLRGETALAIDPATGHPKVTRSPTE